MTTPFNLYLDSSLLRSVDAIAADTATYPTFDRGAAIRFLYVLLRADRHRAWYAYVNMAADRLRALTCHEYKRDVLEPLSKAGVIDWNPRYWHATQPGERSYAQSYRITQAQRALKTRACKVHGLDGDTTRKKLQAYYNKLRQQTDEALASYFDPALAKALYDAACDVQIVGQIARQEHRDDPTMIEAQLARYFRTDLGGRVYTHLSPLRRKLRKYLRIDGKPLAAVDLSASYLRSAILLYEKRPTADANEVRKLRELYMSQDAYTIIDPANRKRGKRSVSAYLCDSDPNRVADPHELGGAASIFFRTRFPSFDRFVRERRGQTMGAQWRLWVARERETMNAIYRELFARGWSGKILDEHDGCRFSEDALSDVLEAVAIVIERDDAGLGKLKYEHGGHEQTWIPPKHDHHTASPTLPSLRPGHPTEPYPGRSDPDPTNVASVIHLNREYYEHVTDVDVMEVAV